MRRKWNTLTDHPLQLMCNTSAKSEILQILLNMLQYHLDLIKPFQRSYLECFRKYGYINILVRKFFSNSKYTSRKLCIYLIYYLYLFLQKNLRFEAIKEISARVLKFSIHLKWHLVTFSRFLDSIFRFVGNVLTWLITT